MIRYETAVLARLLRGQSGKKSPLRLDAFGARRARVRTPIDPRELRHDWRRDRGRRAWPDFAA